MSSSPDIIKDASDALKPISDRKIIVMQGWYGDTGKEQKETTQNTCSNRNISE